MQPNIRYFHNSMPTYVDISFICIIERMVSMQPCFIRHECTWSKAEAESILGDCRKKLYIVWPICRRRWLQKLCFVSINMLSIRWLICPFFPRTFTLSRSGFQALRSSWSSLVRLAILTSVSIFQQSRPVMLPLTSSHRWAACMDTRSEL